MLIEVKTHSPAKRQRKWYFNRRTIRKVIGRGRGGWGIFEPQEFFFVIKFLV